MFKKNPHHFRPLRFQFESQSSFLKAQITVSYLSLQCSLSVLLLCAQKYLLVLSPDASLPWPISSVFHTQPWSRATSHPWIPDTHAQCDSGCLLEPHKGTDTGILVTSKGSWENQMSQFLLTGKQWILVRWSKSKISTAESFPWLCSTYIEANDTTTHVHLRCFFKISHLGCPGAGTDQPCPLYLLQGPWWSFLGVTLGLWVLNCQKKNSMISPQLKDIVSLSFPREGGWCILERLLFSKPRIKEVYQVINFSLRIWTHLKPSCACVTYLWGVQWDWRGCGQMTQVGLSSVSWIQGVSCAHLKLQVFGDNRSQKRWYFTTWNLTFKWQWLMQILRHSAGLVNRAVHGVWPGPPGWLPGLGLMLLFTLLFYRSSLRPRAS